MTIVLFVISFVSCSHIAGVRTSKTSESSNNTKTLPTLRPSLSPISRSSNTTTPPTFRAPDHLVNYVFTDDFYYLVVYNELFVDKTLFIEEFLKLRGYLFSMQRPRKWCKSINLHMLKLFLEIEVDERGERLPDDRRINRKLFVGGEIETAPLVRRKSLKPLKISERPEIMKRQGRHPVLYFRFGSIYGDSYDEIEDRLKSEIEFTYDQYSHLMNTCNLTVDEKDQFERYLERNISTGLIHDSLRFLGELLFRRFNESVFVLIDDYDTPIRQLYHSIGKSWLNRSNSDNDTCRLQYELNRTLELIRPMYDGWIPRNPRIEKTLIMGSYRAHDADLLYCIKGQVLDYDLLDERFSKYFGFTPDDLNELSTKLSLLSSSPSTSPRPLNRTEIDYWYKGYLMGSQLIYNPWSVMQYVNLNGKFDYYWLDYNETYVPPDDEMFLAGTFRTDLTSLANRVPIQLNITKRDVHLVNGFDRTGFVHLLLFTGYLTPTGNVRSMYNLTVPNREIKRLYDNVYKRIKIDRPTI